MTEALMKAPGQEVGVQRNGNAVAKTDQQRAIAEVQAAMMIARMNPRDSVAAMDRLLNACQRPGLAATALYTYARGGSDITGPSIRLAEAAAQAWGNMQFGIRELDQINGESVVQAYAWDVETNTRREVTFQVPHIRYTKNGSYPLKDPRDIYEHVANQGARRVRACILGIIPGDVIEAAVRQCDETLKSTADTSAAAMSKMVEAFGEYGVTREQIEKRIQRRIDAIQPAQVIALRKIYTSLKDGMSGPADWFEQPEKAEDAGKSQTEKLRAKISGSEKKPAEESASVDHPKSDALMKLKALSSAFWTQHKRKPIDSYSMWSGLENCDIVKLSELSEEAILDVLKNAENDAQINGVKIEA